TAHLLPNPFGYRPGSTPAAWDEPLAARAPGSARTWHANPAVHPRSGVAPDSAVPVTEQGKAGLRNDHHGGDRHASRRGNVVRPQVRPGQVARPVSLLSRPTRSERLCGNAAGLGLVSLVTRRFRRFACSGVLGGSGCRL